MVLISAANADPDRPATIIDVMIGPSSETIARDTDRDRFMTSEEAKAYGLVDQVVVSRKEIPNSNEPKS